ncbi:hypothetical protein PE066_19060 [Ramlibacter tataouinensis]|uniref:hypothetical protein n=1 Tax=Ramlibacter tataouinensis TaxID=94132 RepID=UPI0022F3856A|nr:hypothetical protein [Ramlibacter tataouinensis]WBY01538.1 hypothetical protein PE066_19060 [Ramlibacter tataouinensis]
MATEALLDRFYAILGALEQRGQGQTLGSYSGRSGLPKRGVYFFREPGELRRDGSTPRIVRVGTHGLAEGAKSTLWGRLRTHAGTRSGGGNHRGSIFRLHVGAALLAREDCSLPSWGSGSTRPTEVRSNPALLAAEAGIERAVSAYICSMSILWVAVPDEPGASSQRGYIERNAIALLSNRFDPLDPPSAGWLGHHSARSEIRRSGLWNFNHVDEACDPSFLDALEGMAEGT